MPEISSKIQTLIKRRETLGYSQRDIDKIAGVSECQIAKWETGFRKPTLASVERWAAALGLRIELVPIPRKKEKAS